VPELRVDPLSGLRTIIAPRRSERPIELVEPRHDTTCSDPFAAGNEDQTPTELYALPGPDGAWRVRAFENLYPALDAEANGPTGEAKPDLYTRLPASGAHEVIVNSSRAVASLAELTAEELGAAVDAWRLRMRAHANAACVHLSVNEGRGGGASITHTHAQLYAFDFVPALIARERERFGAYATRTMGGSLLGDLVAEEVRRRERVVAIDDEAVLLAPFASLLPYQMLLAPRRPRPRFEDDGPSGASLLGDALGRLARLRGGSPPLNLWVRTAPRGAEHFCWRIDIVPRIGSLAGLELGSGVHLNSVTPERAASELRAA
jgi:UDPglucose--hexose-1-phosphate uridylyltransferase